MFGHTVPVYFLDTGLEDNSPGEQSLTDSLYGGNSYHRLCQEVVLGMGGIAMLDALGFKNINTYHMNEGHAAFLTLALLEQQTERRGVTGGNGLGSRGGPPTLRVYHPYSGAGRP